MIPTLWLARRARHLVADIRDGGRHRQIAELAGLAQHDPRAVAALAVELGSLVVELEDCRTSGDSLTRLLGEQQPADEDALFALITREAHRRHWHGQRTNWVLWGERAYNRARARARRRKPAC